MSLKGGGRRLYSDVQQESTSTTKGGGSDFDSTNPNTLGRTAPFSPDFGVHQSSTTTSEVGTTTTSTGGPVQIAGNPGQLVQIAGTATQSNTLGRTAPLNVSTTTATASLGLEAADTVTTSTLLASPSSPHNAVAFHSSEAPTSPHTAAAFHSSEIPRSPHTAAAFHSSDSHSEERQETVVESKQSTSTVTHESASGLMIQVSDVRAGAELVIEPRIGVQLIEEADKYTRW